jgi:hypothetical protein
LNHFFCGWGFDYFPFEFNEEKYLIFWNGPYFLGPREMYLNKWTSDFNMENDVPSTVPIWVCLSYLPLHCWSDDSHRNNTLRRYINRTKPKENILSHSSICVEFDLEKCIP